MAELLGLLLMNDALCSATTTSMNDHDVLEEMREVGSTTRGDSFSVNELSTNHICPLTGAELQHNYDVGTSTTTDTADCLTSHSTNINHTCRNILRTVHKLHSPQLLTRTTLPLQVIWFSLSFATYGITTWVNTLFHAVHLQNIYLNSFLFALANLPGNIVSILYSDIFGRKRMLVLSLIGAAGGLLGFALLVQSNDNAILSDEDNETKSNARTYGIVCFACIFQMFSIISWNTIDIMTGELFPTCVRSAGMGICTACGRFGAMFAQFVFARLMIIRSGEGEVASAYVLVVAASALLIGAGMPIVLGRDMTLGPLQDELTMGTTNSRCVTLGSMRKMTQKDHLSDDEADNTDGLQRYPMHEYDSIQEESRHRSLEEDEFLL